MTIEIVQGTNKKPASSSELVEILSQESDMSGQLFIGYPIVPSTDGPHPIDALLVSADTGIVIFDLIEGTEPGEYISRQDDSYNKLEAKLKIHRELMSGRLLRIPIHPISFAPGVSNLQHSSTNPIANRDNLRETLKGFNWKGGNGNDCNLALSAIESIRTIRQGGTRRITNQEGSYGSKLENLEKSVSTLDNRQSKAVIETVEGVQRIRGLAGSGKTIILALKAAYLHAHHPDWRIAVTFNTRSLKGQFHNRINSFHLEQANQEPDWERLRIVNAWGAPGDPGRDGIYYEFCRLHDIEYLDFRAATRLPGSDSPFPKYANLLPSKSKKVMQFMMRSS